MVRPSGLVMCGGKGTRLDADVEKPLFEIDGVPMVDRVLSAFEDSRIEDVYAAVSPHAPETIRHLRGRVELVETDGNGFVADALDAIAGIDGPTLSVPADKPLLSGRTLDAVVARYDGRSFGSYTPVELNERLGMNVDHPIDCGGYTCAVTGLNVTSDPPSETRDRREDDLLDPAVKDRTFDARLVVNVNTLEQAAIAEEMLA